MPHHPLTFLFTDLEGSTRLWEQFPEQMKPVLARHDSLLTAAVDAYHGRIVKTTGDGMHAVFESAVQAIGSALAGLLAIENEAWPEGIGPLKVRMGLHSGESQERANDYYGPTVNRAARIMKTAHGGQVLLSSVSAAQVEQALPAEASLLDLGEHFLRDLAQPEHLFQLCHPAIPYQFPPLNSLSRYKHNLPVQLSSFIGRGRELGEIQRLFARTRLLTLLGPGGTGKTRLALQAAADMVDQFPDGAWFIELAPLTDPEAIADRIAEALFIHMQPGRPILDTLTDALRRKELLLVLDNVEHLVHAGAALAEHLLAHCPKIKILVTGREALFIEGETTLQIPSLSLPQEGEPAAEQVAESEAVHLFLARAQAVRPDFDITAENAGAIIEIVRRLDGIPLALELAAARLRMLSVEQIAGRLNDRFRLLTGGRRTALPRQQTLQALIDWSWNLLEEKERLLLRRLAVFSGGWTLEAAQAVVSDDQLDEYAVLNLLEQLINKSLVNVDHLPRGEVRYGMLESIRQYARDRLFESGEAEGLRDRHAGYFSAYAQKVGKALEGRDMLAWLDPFLRETDNARTAREWALESRLDLALKFTQTSMLVQRYWFFSSAGRRWLQQLVEQARAHPALETELEYQRGLAAATIALGSATFAGGDIARAPTILREGVTLADAAGIVEQQVYGLNMLLISLLQVGEVDSASAVAEEALSVSKQEGLEFMRMMTLGSFSPIFAFQGENVSARANTEEAIRMAQQHGNPWMQAMASLQKGRLYRQEDRLAEAERCYLEAADLFATVRDISFSYIARSEAGHMKRLLGDYAGAEQIYRQTILFFLEGEGRSAVIHQLECFGMVAAYQGQFRRAAELMGAAQALRTVENSLRLPAEQVEFDQALAYLAEAMGTDQRDAVMAGGHSMSFEAAVDLALLEYSGV